MTHGEVEHADRSLCVNPDPTGSLDPVAEHPVLIGEAVRIAMAGLEDLALRHIQGTPVLRIVRIAHD